MRRGGGSASPGAPSTWGSHLHRHQRHRHGLRAAFVSSGDSISAAGLGRYAWHSTRVFFYKSKGKKKVKEQMIPDKSQ